jgi:putative membrane protein
MIDWVGDPTYGWWWIIALVKLAFFIAVLFVVIGLLRSKGRTTGLARPHALSVLEERYARGEITRDEFVERRSVLLGEEPSPPAP